MPTSAITPATSRPRAGVLAGLLYVLFFVASLALPGILGQHDRAPIVTPYSSDVQVARYLTETSRGLVAVAAFCQAMSALSLLVFVPYATAQVRRIAPEGAYSGLVRSAGTVAAALLLLSSSVQWVLNRPGTGDNLQVYRAVSDLVFVTGAAAQVAPTGLLIGAVAAAALKSRDLPGWLNWLGLTVAAVSVLSVLSFLAEAATAFIPLGRYLGMIWFLGLTVTLLRRRIPSSAPAISSVSPQGAASPARERT